MRFGRLFTICSVAAVMLIIAVTATAAEYEDTIEKSFRVGEDGTLTVETDAGPIRVRTGGGDSVEVSIDRGIDPPDGHSVEEILEDFDITMEQHGDDVDVEVKTNWSWNNGGFWRIFTRSGGRLNIEIDVTVPRTYNIDLHTSGGGIEVDDLDGSVVCHTSGGGIELGVIDGPVRAETSGGGIRMEGALGAASLETSGGGITIGDVDGDMDAHTSGGPIRVGRVDGRARVRTSGGGITIEEVTGEIDASTSGGSVTAYISGQPSGDCRLTTSGGGVTVYVNPDSRFSIDAHSSGGGVHASGLTVTLGKKEDHSLVADMNGGGPELYLRSSGGGVHINPR